MPSLTQTQINNSVDWAINTFQGQKVADEFGGYVGECVSLVRREFVHRTGINEAPNSPNGYGDGYLQLPGAFNDYFTVESFDRTKPYPRGSYAINKPTRHIMIYLQRVGADASVFEQNADPDDSPAGIKTRNGAKISHILIPKIIQGATSMADVPQADQARALYAACIFGEFILGRIGLVQKLMDGKLATDDDIRGHVGYWLNSPAACDDLIAGFESGEGVGMRNDLFISHLCRNATNNEAAAQGRKNVGSVEDVQAVFASIKMAATPKQIAAAKVIDALQAALKS